MKSRSAVLSPRGRPAALEDLASRGRLIAGQRVDPSRLRRRALRRARHVGERAALLALALGVLGGAAWAARWLLTAPRFAVTHIEVRGQSRMTGEEVLAASGIVPGTNLFRLDAGAAAARLEGLPLVKRAEIIRDYPDRVTVVVEERRPFTLVHSGRLHWIDEQGVDLGPETRAVTPGAPVISGLAASDLARVPGGPTERLAAGLALLRMLLRSGSSLLAQISEIDVSWADGPVLYTVDGVEVRLGGLDWEARLGRLDGVLAQLRAAGEAVTSVDLRFRDQVVFKTAGR